MSNPSHKEDKLLQFGEGEYGRFIVAGERIQQGEVVLWLKGALSSKPTQYTVQLEEDVHLDAGARSWRFTQHSCDPNMRLDILLRAFVSLRHIEGGELLTFNYNSTERSLSTPFKCACGSIHCVGEIRGYSALTAEEQNRIESTVLPYLLVRSR